MVQSGILTPVSCGSTRVLVWSEDYPSERFACSIDVLPSEKNFSILDYMKVKNITFPNGAGDAGKIKLFKNYYNGYYLFSVGWQDGASEGDTGYWQWELPWTEVVPYGWPYKELVAEFEIFENKCGHEISAEMGMTIPGYR